MPGPKSKISNLEIKKLINEGYLKKDIAELFEVSFSTIKRRSKGLKTERKNSRYICKDCNVSEKDQFYDSCKYYCKGCFNRRSYRAQKDKIFEYMESRGGARCQLCGYDRCINALEFHHRDPKEKDPNWSRGWRLERLKIELDKCDILCANCHREVHAKADR